MSPPLKLTFSRRQPGKESCLVTMQCSDIALTLTLINALVHTNRSFVFSLYTFIRNHILLVIELQVPAGPPKATLRTFLKAMR